VAEPALGTVDTLPPEWEVTRLAAVLREHLPDLRARYGPDSDLDVLVTLSRTLSMFDLIHLSDDLTDALGVAVDVAQRDHLQPRIARYILREALEL